MKRQIISRFFSDLGCAFGRINVWVVAVRGTPYVAVCEQSPSFEALSSRRLRRDGSPRRIPDSKGKVRRIVRQAVAIRNLEVGRTRLRSGDAMLPRLGPVLAVRRVDGAPSPSHQGGGLAAGCSRRSEPSPSGASPWQGACSSMPA